MIVTDIRVCKRVLTVVFPRFNIFYFSVKGVEILICLRKAEVDYLRKNNCDCHIVVTGRQKNSRSKRWYVEETPWVLDMLDEYYAAIRKSKH